MGLSVAFVSGPRGAGKSAVIRTMIDRLWRTKPHYIRLVAIGSDKRRPESGRRPPADAGVASARWLEYDTDRIFEVLPDALTEIHRQDRYGAVVVEADSDPSLRCAYPYDHRVFVMPVPSALDQVFRNPRRAAIELQRVLDDTASFASEIFGLFKAESQKDPDPPEDRPYMTESQMRSFLHSPLGDELATRIQLQPPYHGLVESEVIIVNTGVGKRTAESDECLRRIRHLLE
ncbi:MAG: hypothetical protein ACE5HE_11240, partial [Phycisphaerae bacterium]